MRSISVKPASRRLRCVTIFACALPLIFATYSNAESSIPDEVRQLMDACQSASERISEQGTVQQTLINSVHYPEGFEMLIDYTYKSDGQHYIITTDATRRTDDTTIQLIQACDGSRRALFVNSPFVARVYLDDKPTALTHPAQAAIGHLAADIAPWWDVLSDATWIVHPPSDADSDHSLYEATLKGEIYRFWIDPNSPNLIRKVEVEKTSAGLYQGAPLSTPSPLSKQTGGNAFRTRTAVTFVHDDITYETIDGIVVPMSGHYELVVSYASKAEERTSGRYQRTHVALDPQFTDADFIPEICDGTPVYHQNNTRTIIGRWGQNPLIPEPEEKDVFTRCAGCKVCRPTTAPAN